MRLRKWSRLKFAGFASLVFLAGAVVSNNMSRLVPTNPAYRASWGKVAFAAFLAVAFAGAAWLTAKGADDA